MADRSKLLYIIVHDEESESTEARKNPLTSSFRYTRSVLQSTLQLIGCKPRHAFKISMRVFSVLKNGCSAIHSEKNGSLLQGYLRYVSDSDTGCTRVYSCGETKQVAEGNMPAADEFRKELVIGNNFCSTAVVSREEFLDVVSAALSAYRYVGPDQRGDLLLACRIRERKTSMTILLCGTSGCGKSTLSSLLASRLGITTVVSTDSIRHMMRSFIDEKENPLLWASTYHAGEYLDPAAVAEAKAKKKEKKMEGISPRNTVDTVNSFYSRQDVKGKGLILNEASASEGSQIIVKPKVMAVQGYKAQSEMVIDSLDRLITSWEQKCESVVVEGVHLSLNFVMELMKKHPSIIPFMFYIANEEKHLERFAVRAKYMTLDPAKNKYVKYICNIRTIQDYLCKRADKHLVPKVNNTNVDRSIAAIHATIFGCLRRREGGESLYDQATNTVKVVDEEYRNQCAANSLGSKGMLQFIRRGGSSRQLVALVNTDGSVARAWSFESGDIGHTTSTTGNIHEVGSPRFEPSAVEKAQPVNLQFGNFGLSAWETDLAGTSHNGSIDGLSAKGEYSENSISRRSSSCSSTPRHGDGAEKELINESAVSGSEEEPEEEVPDAESDDDIDIGNKQLEEHELEGSVDDQSIRSDEDEEELATVDDQDDRYWSGDFGEDMKLGASEYVEKRGAMQEQQKVSGVGIPERSVRSESEGNAIKRHRVQNEEIQSSGDTVHEKSDSSSRENGIDTPLFDTKMTQNDVLGCKLVCRC